MLAPRFRSTRLFGLTSAFALGMSLLVAPAPADAQTLTAAAISETSDTYMLAVGWSNVLRSADAGPEITPLSGGGTVRLLRGVASGEWDIGFMSTAEQF